MTRYENLGGGSGITYYELGEKYIKVQFSDYSVYEYTETSVGISNLRVMKSLAQQGSGLNSFINREVRKNYSRKIR